MTDPPHHNRFLGSTGDDRFLRPDLRQAGRRAQGRSSMAPGLRTREYAHVNSTLERLRILRLPDAA